jgi:hypothetical protein
MTDPTLTAARAAADQQYELVNQTLDAACIDHARALLATRPEVDVWALLGTEICRSLGLSGKLQQFAAECLAAAAIRLAKLPRE